MYMYMLAYMYMYFAPALVALVVEHSHVGCTGAVVRLLFALCRAR